LAPSSKQELFCWLAGTSLAIVFFALSHTFYVTTATYCYGLALLSLVAFLFWLRFRRNPDRRPKWLMVIANSALVILTLVSLLYLLGVATWYE
jgi:amino acid transporter